MDTLGLYDILDFILNRATSAELDAIRAALRRRESDMPDDVNSSGKGALGTNIRDLALSTAEKIQGQVGVSQDGIRDLVHRTVRDIIAREAPELEPSQVDELLAGIVSGGKTDAPTGNGQTLPKEAILSMVEQFVEYSTGSMPVREEMSLTEQMGKWQHRYWEAFPQVVRRLIALFVKGAMNGSDFWRGIDDALEHPTGS